MTTIKKTIALTYAYPSSPHGKKTGGWYFEDENGEKLSDLYSTGQEAIQNFLLPNNLFIKEGRNLVNMPSYVFSKTFFKS